MDPITHTLTALTLSRAGLNKVTPWAAPMLIASSLAADLDWLTSLGGPEAFLRGNRTATHSLLGTAVIALFVAAAFWAVRRNHAKAPVRFGPALVVCAAGAGVHLLMDLANSYGVMLLWPFRRTWFAWDLVDTIDVAVLLWILLGLLLPPLFRLITEEIGAKGKRSGPQRGAIVALAAVLLWVGLRWGMHDRAMEMMRVRVYNGESPVDIAALPTAASPLEWKGVVETESLFDVMDVPLGPHAIFDPLMGRMYFKPETSAALDEARRSILVQRFLEFARFPRMTLQRTENGYHFELKDMRFDTWMPGRQVPRVVVELNPEMQLLSEKLYFAPAMVR